MLLSDTIVGAWSSSGRGPLGPLAEPVRAGMIAEVTETEQAALWAAYPELPLPSNPFWDDSPEVMHTRSCAATRRVGPASNG